MDIWIVTAESSKYDFLKLYYNTKVFKTYKDMSKWLLCADIARPGYAFFDMIVNQETFFSFRNTPQIEESISLLKFSLVLPSDEIDLARRAYEVGAKAVLADPLKPNVTRAFLEHYIQRAVTHDVPIRNSFKGMATDLTQKETMILEVFARMPDYKVTGDTLRRACWGEEKRQEKNLETHVSNIKGKIRKLGYTITKEDQEYRISKIGLGN